MVKKILFILIFALLLLIFLNSNSFANDLRELPSDLQNNMSNEYKEYFENFSKYFIITKKADHSFFIIFFYDSFNINVTSTNFTIYAPYYRCQWNGSKISESHKNSSDTYPYSSFKSDTYEFIYSNYDVLDNNGNIIFYTNLCNNPTPIVYYTITYNLNGGSGSSHTDVVQAGNSVNLWSGSSFSPPEDKTFVGWSTSSTAASSDITSPYTPTGDITLYAVYEYNTSGIISGIRNLINSITNGFSSIANFLNPNSVDTSNAESSVNNTATDIQNKFNFKDSIKQNIDDMVEIITDTESAPTFTVNVDSERYSGEVTVIDLSWYAPYREYGNNVICIFAYLSFLWNMFLKLPSIIHGGEASSYAGLMIGDRETYDKTGFGRSWTLKRR